MNWINGVMAVMQALAGVFLLADVGGATDLPVGRPVPIKELRERTSSLIGRDVVVAGLVEVAAPITEANFDDWRLMSPCAGSYYVTLKDETGMLGVLVKGNCLRRPPLVNGPWIAKGEKVWMKVSIFVPNLNPFELNPLVRAIVKDFGVLSAE
ncbi:MAG: hypothetical protein H8J66_02440 [Nitrospira sp.]|nr:hypothetical protein [Nitrospira sp.]